MRRYLLALFLCFVGSVALAHNAPTGWSYDSECCGGQDCRQIESTDVTEQEGGAFMINATKEIFYAPGKAPMVPSYSPEGTSGMTKGKEYKWSKDEFFHRCSSMGTEKGTTFCLYVPQPSI